MASGETAVACAGRGVTGGPTNERSAPCLVIALVGLVAFGGFAAGRWN